eukprot:119505-Hanusia_phi.AAC.1
MERVGGKGRREEAGSPGGKGRKKVEREYLRVFGGGEMRRDSYQQKPQGAQFELALKKNVDQRACFPRALVHQLVLSSMGTDFIRSTIALHASLLTYRGLSLVAAMCGKE